MSGTKRNREWNRLNEMLGIPTHDGVKTGRLEGYQIIRPGLTVPAERGAVRQLAWVLDNWVRPYLNRVRAGIDYDPRLHRPPVEPDWRATRGRGNLPSTLTVPYGDDWETWWHRRGKAKREAERKRVAARRRASD